MNKNKDYEMFVDQILELIKSMDETLNLTTTTVNKPNSYYGITIKLNNNFKEKKVQNLKVATQLT